MWEYVGMGRNEEGLKKGITLIRELKIDFWKDVKIPGSKDEINTELEKAVHLADFIDLAELIAMDALNRNESCGGHFRVEQQSEEGEALRNDQDFAYVAAWEYQGEGQEPKLNKEELKFESVEMKQRIYK